jgi:hypothetical protein
MASHKLSLEIPDTTNPAVFKIFDTSVYTNLIPVTCPQLYITAPGFQTSALLEGADIPGQDFSLTLTACKLGLQTTNCSEVMNKLPDGIYAIRYAVSPHEYVYVEYNHLRITQALLKVDELLCDLDLADCVASKDKADKLKEIMTIKGYLLAAKAKVEHCHDANKGKIIYDYALKMIEKATCKYC